jgi:delta(3,5)-delta(2,4)-dienoyl-CoA isomerase
VRPSPPLSTSTSHLDFLFSTVTTAAAVGDAVSPSGQDSARASLGIRNVLRDFQHAIGAPDRCVFPVIVAVHGPVIGLGVDLISACDVRYASKDAVFAIKVYIPILSMF